MKEMDNMSIRELEAIALDSSIQVPEGFGKSIRQGIDTLAFLEGAATARPRRIWYAASIAASLALLIGIGLGVNGYMSRPKDTFSDPQQAYAMLEQSFSLISSKMDKGVASVTHETEAVLTRTNEIIDKLK
ncbi:MAG: hypothetical protein IKX29_03425 [Bacteroidales bacterium]|nr:hypothetical protein [Bacteroidales bacterium]